MTQAVLDAPVVKRVYDEKYERLESKLNVGAEKREYSLWSKMKGFVRPSDFVTAEKVGEDTVYKINSDALEYQVDKTLDENDRVKELYAGLRDPEAKKDFRKKLAYHIFKEYAGDHGIEVTLEGTLKKTKWKSAGQVMDYVDNGLALAGLGTVAALVGGAVAPPVVAGGYLLLTGLRAAVKLAYNAKYGRPAIEGSDGVVGKSATGAKNVAQSIATPGLSIYGAMGVGEVLDLLGSHAKNRLTTNRRKGAASFLEKKLQMDTDAAMTQAQSQFQQQPQG